MINLRGKVAVITGANRGLGKAIAIEFAKCGAIVAINYRKTKGAAQSALKVVCKYSPRSIIYRADVTKESEVNKMFSAVARKFKRVDILVNNVGNFCFCDFSKLGSAQFKDVIESNIYGTLNCSRAALKYMRKQKSGNIINIGCAGCDSIIIRRKTTPYYIAKIGVYMLTKIMALEEKSNVIKINIVSPGVMENTKAFPKDSSARVVKFQEVVNAILKILAKKKTGQHIKVTGGWLPPSQA